VHNSRELLEVLISLPTQLKKLQVGAHPQKPWSFTSKEQLGLHQGSAPAVLHGHLVMGGEGVMWFLIQDQERLV
jgi:hypothetical protein